MEPHTRREASRTHLALQLGFLGRPGDSQVVDHVLELLIALHQHADLVAQVQAAGRAGGLGVNAARCQGSRALARSHAHGQQPGRRGQHVLNDRPELVQLRAGEKAVSEAQLRRFRALSPPGVGLLPSPAVIPAVPCRVHGSGEVLSS